NVTHLECAACGARHEARRLHNLCGACAKPLLVRYDLEQAARTLTKESLKGRRADLWRYLEVLPVEHEENIVSLGEGFTPLLHAARLGESLGLKNLYIKDESQNPTQSFKARGMAEAVSTATALGARNEAVRARRGQADARLRVGRTARLGAAGLGRLPDGRRHGPHRHVEGLRRDGGARTRRREAPAHGDGSSTGLRAGRARLRGGPAARRRVSERRDGRLGLARP